MERTKRMFIGLACFLLVMGLGISFSYGEGPKFSPRNGQIGPNIAGTHTWVFVGSGNYTKYTIGGDPTKEWGTVTGTSIGLTPKEDNGNIMSILFSFTIGRTIHTLFINGVFNDNKITFGTKGGSSQRFGTLYYYPETHTMVSEAYLVSDNECYVISANYVME
jgi:hypothetical protein